MLAEHTRQKAQKADPILIIGIGNDYRSDDAVGLLVARELRKQVPTQVRVVECAEAGFELIEMWDGAHSVIIVDAVCSGTDPGTIHRIEVHKQPLPSYLFRYSTHGFNVADSIELARTLGKLPPHMVVFGIECINFDHGSGLSEDMAIAVETATSRVLECVQSIVKEDKRQKV